MAGGARDRRNRLGFPSCVYNVIFPIWLLVWWPSWLWILLIPANYLIDHAVLWWSLDGYAGSGSEGSGRGRFSRNDFCRSNAWKVCIAGFLADFIASALLLGIDLLLDAVSAPWELGYALMVNPFGNPLALLITCAAIAIAGAIIFMLDRWVLQRAGVEPEQAKASALKLAIITAPYLFLIPVGIL